MARTTTHETYPIKEKSNHKSRLAYSRFIVGPLSSSDTTNTNSQEGRNWEPFCGLAVRWSVRGTESLKVRHVLLYAESDNGTRDDKSIEQGTSRHSRTHKRQARADRRQPTTGLRRRRHHHPEKSRFSLQRKQGSPCLGQKQDSPAWHHP